MVKFCYDIITFWMCGFNLVLTRCFFNEKHKKINYRKRVEHDNCMLVVMLVQSWWAQSNKVQWILALPLPSS